jgi:hypothetical protein
VEVRCQQEELQWKQAQKAECQQKQEHLQKQEEEIHRNRF